MPYHWVLQHGSDLKEGHGVTVEIKPATFLGDIIFTWKNSF